jgi:hypothetical protein
MREAELKVAEQWMPARASKDAREMALLPYSSR